MSLNSSSRRFQPVMSSYVIHSIPPLKNIPDMGDVLPQAVETPLMAHRVWVEPSTPASQLSPRHIPPPMSNRQKLAYAMGHVLNDMSAACWFSYLLVLLQKAQGLSATHAGAVLLAGQFADAVATPLVGIFSDASHGWETCKLGRRKLYYLLGTVFVIINYFLVFGLCIPCSFYHTDPIPSHNTNNNTTQLTPLHDDVAHYPEDDEIVLTIYYCIAASLFNVGWAAVQVSHMALVPELSTDEHERVVLNSARYAFTVGSNILVFMVLCLFIYVFDFDKPQQFHYLADVSLIVGVITSLIFLIGTHEQPAREHHAKKDPNWNWKNWFYVKEFYTVGMVYMFTRLVVNVSQVFLPFFIIDVLLLSEVYITIIPCVVYISSFISAAYMKRINKKIGRLKTFALGSILCGLALIGFLLLEPDLWYLVFPCSVLLGLGNATIMVCSVQLEADLVDMNNASGAFVYGALSFTDKLSNGIAIFFLQLQNDDTSDYIRKCCTIVPLASCVLGFAVAMTIDVSKLKKLTPSGYTPLLDDEQDGMINVVKQVDQPVENPWRRASIENNTQVGSVGSIG